MSPGLRHYDAAETRAALPYPALIDALDAAFRAGGEAMPVRTVLDVGQPAAPGALLLMPAWERGRSVGVKLVTFFPANNARGASALASLYLLFDGRDGSPRALIDGETLTCRRTAAASALASRYLSRADSRTLLLVGTGNVAAQLPHAHRTVRPIERVLVWGRDGGRAGALAGRLTAEGFAAVPVASIAAGLAEADIVSCATASRAPLVHGRDLRPGTHLDLVGGFTPEMRESDDEAVALSRVFVDTRAGALAEAGDLLQPAAAGAWAVARTEADLHELARGEHQGRTGQDEITLFKSVGAAIEDLAAARLVAGQ